MGNSNLQRDAVRARSAYFGALQRWSAAMTGFQQAQVPLGFGEMKELPPWNREHVETMMTCVRAWRELVEARRRYDTVRRELGNPALRPYA